MTYILEALRKSAAERRLGQVPALDVPPEVTAAPAPVGGRGRRLRGIGVVLGAVLVAGNLALTLWLWWDRHAPASAPSGTGRAQPAGARPAAPPSTALEVPAAGSGQGTPAAAPTRAAAARPLHPRPLAGPVPVEAPPVAVVPATDVPPATPSVARTVVHEKVSAREAEVPAWTALPESVRARLHRPHLDVHVYDDDPARRFVRLDQRKYREGETTAGGFRVERITRAGVVLSRQGVRFLLPRP
ncbi:MAG: hypothetical protein D6721_00520 [Gammaproteobacteria bacterium]|nr:MAG: hypothetical protein D6721_00520 [Gammaproteobacteria bacterium]